MQMNFNKTRSIEVRFVIGPQNILFAGVCVRFFSPEIVWAGAEKGLINTHSYTPSLITLCNSMTQTATSAARPNMAQCRKTATPTCPPVQAAFVSACKLHGSLFPARSLPCWHYRYVYIYRYRHKQLVLHRQHSVYIQRPRVVAYLVKLSRLKKTGKSMCQVPSQPDM